ncbi:TonB-dependent siderophore receptor [Rheinheimera riviphila]|nr:TonB-dependent siderophore receptor [Rheinheimera riviphila]
MKLNFPCAVLTASLFYPLMVNANSLAQTADLPVVATEGQGEPIEKISVSYHQAYRGNVPDNELPQAIQLIDRELLQDLAISRFQDALDLSASIARQNNGGGLWDSFSLRGFPGNENMPSGYLINGFSAGRGFSGHRDVSNIAYVEILKGPGSALYGRSEPGGTINMVTRKPQFASEGYLKLSSGSFSQHRLEGDFTDAVTDQLAFRLSGAVQDYGSFRDKVTSDKQVLTPSLLWQIDADSSLLYEFEYLEQDQLFDRGLVVLNGDFNTVPRSRYLGEPADGPTEISALGHQLTYQKQLNAGWSFNSGMALRTSDLQGFSSDAELARARQSLFDDGSTLSRQRRYRDYQSEDVMLRFEFSGTANLLGITHQLLLGADGYDYQLFTQLQRYRGAKGSYALDIHQPQYCVATPGALAVLYENSEQQQAYGVYLQDQLELSAAWRLMLGLRFDQYQQEIHERLKDSLAKTSDQQLSPRIGLVYVLNPELSIYSSYSEGFLPLSGTDFYGDAFAPEQSQSAELGLKFQLAGFNGTLALFDAKKSNILTSDPINEGFSAPLGKARSQGLELDVQSMLTDSLQAILSYSYLDTRTVVDAVNLDWGIVVPAGSRLVNVPKHTFSATLTQQLQLADYPAKIGSRLRYSSARLGDSVQPSYQLPSFTLWSLFTSVELNQHWQLEAVLDNLFDRHYIQSSYSALWSVPGEPRSVRLSLRYDF